MSFRLKSGGIRCDGSSSLGLQRRLLEVAVVVGMDEEIGLQCRNKEHAAMKDAKNPLFQTHFKPHLLDIVSGVQDYADSTFSRGLTSAESVRDPKNPLLQTNSNNPRSRRVNKSACRSRSVRKLRKRAGTGEIVPVSNNFLNNLPLVCLPDDSRVSELDLPPQIHFAVLTDIKGTRHYTVVLKMYRHFYATKEFDAGALSWKLAREKFTGDFSSDSPDEVTACYVPLCICLVTNTSYFDVLKRTVSILYQEWKASSSYELFRVSLQQIVTNLSMISCPPPNIRIQFRMSGLPFTMHPPENSEHEGLIDDMDLSFPLHVFSWNVETLLHVLACIMLEHRVVFVSRNYSLITLVIEALLRYIAPFTWPHQYVPVLFSETIEFVACPGIFLMGCHSMHKEQIKQVDNDQILVDLDTGQALVCPSYEWKSRSNKRDLRSLDEEMHCHFPPNTIKKVIRRLRELKLFHADCLNSPEATNLKQVYEEQVAKKMKFNSKIKNIFMEMMVDLFGNTLRFLDRELHRFLMDEFMETLSDSDLPFYHKVMETAMFKKFIKVRIQDNSDAFSKSAESKQPGSIDKNSSSRRTLGKFRATDFNRNRTNQAANRRPTSTKLSRSSLKCWSVRARTNSAETTEVDGSPSESTQIKISNQTIPTNETKPDVLTLNLPPFPIRTSDCNTRERAGRFYYECVDTITELMKSIPDHSDAFTITHSLRASCLLLRGVYQITSGSLLQGLEDLHEIAKEEISQFPHSMIKTLIDSLTESERELIQSQPFYNREDFNGNYEDFGLSEPFYYSGGDLMHSPLDKLKFCQIMEKRGISSNGDVINLLFEALSSQSSSSTSEEEEQSSSVDPEVFAAFYHSWRQNQHDCEIALRGLIAAGDVNAHLLSESERLLKVSSVVSTNKGSGRLILTTDKIIFLTETYEECKLVARLNLLREISLSRSKLRFLSSTTTLVLKYGGSEGSNEFRVDLKSDSELWQSLIEEMKIGGKFAEESKDSSMTSEVAAQNVCVVDALYQAATDGEIMNQSSALLCGKRLCYFTALQKSGQLKTLLSPETYNLLLSRIDLSPKESRKSSIKCILFAEAGIDETPYVWVGLSSSKIRCINTTTWQLDSRPVKDWNSDLCSLAMVDQQLWVGAADKNIYVVGCDSLKTTQVLHGHTAPVVAIFSCGREIVSASSNGEIIVWNKETKRKTSSFCIVEPHNDLISACWLYKDVICCCSKSSLSLYTLDGACAQLLSTHEWSNFNDDAFTCFTCVDSDEIWVGNSSGNVFVWQRKTFRGNTDLEAPLGDRYNRFVPKCSGAIFSGVTKTSVTSLLISWERKVWVGNSVGDITLLNGDSLCRERTLKAHDAAVTSLCSVKNRCILSGSNSKDGRISIWRSGQM